MPENGVVNVEDVENAIREDTALVTIMFANNEIGTLQPIKEIGAVCKKHGVVFHTDAVQAAGHVKIDVNELNMDMLSIFRSQIPWTKGCRCFICQKTVPLTNVIEGGAQERGKRAGTENLPGIVGMAVSFTGSLC